MSEKTHRKTMRQRFNIRQRLLLLAAFAVLLISSRGAQAKLVYNFVDQAALQNGYTLSDVIIVIYSAPDDGALLSGEITSWEVLISGPALNTTFNSTTGDGNTAFTSVLGTVAISPTTISLDSEAASVLALNVNGATNPSITWQHFNFGSGRTLN